MTRPHGGSLTNNFIDLSRIDKDLFTLDVDTGLKKEIENISFGVFRPLKGFLNEEDFIRVAKKVKDSSQVALRNDGQIFGVMQVEDLYKFDKTESAKSVFQTDDPSHPGFNKFVTMQDILIAGEVKTVSTPPNNKFSENLRLTPAESRKKIEDRGWKSTVAFQTRNVPHVAHEMLQKAALNIYDGLFINPLIGKKKVGDFKDDVILNSYMVLIDNYYPKYRIIFSTLHTEMKYAGPREAIHHAIMRQNFGCSHIIIGRDHAGVGNYYSPFAAHDIFKEYPDLGIEPIFFPAFYYCKKCSNFANERICPHDSIFKEELSGTKMRKMFLSGLLPPAHLMRTEISQIISLYKNPFVE